MEIGQVRYFEVYLKNHEDINLVFLHSKCIDEFVRAVSA